MHLGRLRFWSEVQHFWRPPLAGILVAGGGQFSFTMLPKIPIFGIGQTEGKDEEMAKNVGMKYEHLTKRNHPLSTPMHTWGETSWLFPTFSLRRQYNTLRLLSWGSHFATPVIGSSCEPRAVFLVRQATSPAGLGTVAWSGWSLPGRAQQLCHLQRAGLSQLVPPGQLHQLHPHA